MVALAVLARCRFCSKSRDPREFTGPPVTHPCWRCYELHLIALRLLAGERPPDDLGCNDCGAGQGELKARRAQGDIPGSKMFMHPKDGIYQPLCGHCSDRYERQRLDLYGDTPYGHLKKLRGAK